MFGLSSILFILLTFSEAFASDSLSYSGRLVNADGSPVTDKVNLKVELANTNDLTTVLCNQSFTDVPLTNGVFHLELNPTCTAGTITDALAATGATDTIAIRVTDETHTKEYSFQTLHALPLASVSQTSKQLVQLGATNGQVLAWDGTKWRPVDHTGLGGTVTSVTAGTGLDGGTITTIGTISLADGGVTATKIHQMGATVGQVLKWTAGGWAPSADVDTGLTSESDPFIRKFARNDGTGIAPGSCAPNQALHYILMTDTLECIDIVLDAIETNRVVDAAVDDAIVDAVVNVAPSQNAVFDALAGKQASINGSSDITMKYLKLMTDGAFWVGLKAPIATAQNLLFTLPASDGTAGQVLKTDGAGNLGWMNATDGSVTSVSAVAPLAASGTNVVTVSLQDGGITDAKVSATAAIAWSKISKTGAVASDLGAVPSTRTLTAGTALSGGGDLTLDRTFNVNYDNSTIGVNGSNQLIVNPGGITNTQVHSAAAIDWTKISKIGAVASDVGAVPTSRTISAGTGLLGGGDLSANRTFNVDVGTTANKIVQLDANAKLPAIDGSQLTNLGTNWGKWSDATGGIHYSSGNVGVGTATPGGKIHSEINEIGAGLMITDLAAPAGSITIGEAGSAVNTFAPLINGRPSGSDKFTGLYSSVLAGEDIGTTPALILAGRNEANTLTNRPVLGVQNFTTRLMTVLAGGNVGIGTETPRGKLELNVGATATADPNDSNNYPLKIASNEWLTGQVTGIEFWNGSLKTVPTARIATQMAGSGSGGENLLFQTQSPDAANPNQTTPTTKMVITAAGSVGIGTASPAAKLDVNGGIRVGTMATCGAAQEGSQRYNSTLKIMEFCDGTSWKAFGATPTLGQNSCAWINVTTCGHGCGLGTYYQAVCPVGKYVAGWSTNTWNEYSAHNFRIYCCSP